eukprot:Tbor_TRINITY_DN3799_c0_g1::TRINITY_DN3799_c0_g1_i1::g.2381::m.2381
MNTPNLPFSSNSRETRFRSSWAPSANKYLRTHQHPKESPISQGIHHPHDAKAETIAYFCPETQPPPTPFPYSQLCAYPMTKHADAHFLNRFLCWCACKGIFIHPAVQLSHHRSEYRDLRFTLRYRVSRHVPLFAIPEELVIGFKDISDESARDDEYRNSELYDRDKEKAFNLVNTGRHSNSSDDKITDGDPDGDSSAGNKADICNFFFKCLGLLVGDLISAQKSSLSDTRYEFAESLSKVRNLPNAPYIPENTVFASSSTFAVSEDVLREAREEEDKSKKKRNEELTAMRSKRVGISGDRSSVIECAGADTVGVESSSKKVKEAENGIRVNSSFQQSEHAQGKGTELSCDAEKRISQKKDEVTLKDKKETCIPEAPSKNVCMSLPDIVLQMIRNYINGGPLTNKVQRKDLLWTISVCLSHSTPLVIGHRRSIGIIPLVHLMEHGGTGTNCSVLARPPPNSPFIKTSHKGRSTNEETISKKMAGYFTRICSGGAVSTATTNNSANDLSAIEGVNVRTNNRNNIYDIHSTGVVQLFSRHNAEQRAVDFGACIGGYGTHTANSDVSSKHTMSTIDIVSSDTLTSDSYILPLSMKTRGYIYVTSLAPMRGGEVIKVQAMSPVCPEYDDEDSEDMWRLSMGAVPMEYLSSKEVARIGEKILQEIL